ncbi:MAG TPA: ribonuclease HIII [Candidatus Thermoplasmatota archaeon]|nr:ribonuclease HIII [Candidatus Thermoplasmatota archaeon]
MAGSVVLVVDPARAGEVRRFLESDGFVFERRPHAFFLARSRGVTATFYESGKLLATGPRAEAFAADLARRLGLAAGAPRPEPPAGRIFVPRAGLDESGKGDYFGPLVVAAVAIPTHAVERDLVARGVADSKTVEDARCLALDEAIRASAPAEVVVFEPEDYNARHARSRNLNLILAEGHARALEGLLARHPVDVAIADQFGAASLIENALLERGRRVTLEQRVRAESDPAVAAASLVARATFLRALADLSDRWGVRLAKGAGPPVIESGRAFVRRHGRDALAKVAKVHFATTGSLGKP